MMLSFFRTSALHLGLFFYIVAGSTAQAGLVAYLSDAQLGDGAPPSNLDLELGTSAVGTSGSFNIWIKTDELVSQVALYLWSSAPAIKFTDALVPQYAPRWAWTSDGDVSPDGSVVTGLNAFALPGFSSNGLDPVTSGNDPAYDPVTGAYHFATIDYEVVAAGQAELWLNLETEDFGADCIQFGIGDVCSPTDVARPGIFPNPLADGLITVVPEPATSAVALLLVITFAPWSFRRRSST